MNKAINIDMRYNEILHEFIIKLDNVIIYRNPIKPVIQNLIGKSQSGYREEPVRGLVIEKKIYVWAASDGIHNNIMNSLKREVVDVNTFSTFYLTNGNDGIYYTDFYNYSIDDAGKIERLFNQESVSAYGNRKELARHIERWNS